MAKFSKGDKVESVKTGAKGVVDEVYGDEKYSVLFDGATNPDRVEGFQIKAANGCARNAKFEIGEWVEFEMPGFGKMLGAVDSVKGGRYYIEEPKSGITYIVDEKDIKRKVVAKSQIFGNSSRIASPASTNAVVQNAINARRARNAVNPNDVKRGLISYLDMVLQHIVKARNLVGVWDIDDAQGIAYDIDDLRKECENLIKAIKQR